MADTIATSDVFKFVTLRAPTEIDKRKQQKHFIRDPRPFQQSMPGAMLLELGAESNGRVTELIQELINRHGFSADYPRDDAFFVELDAAITKARRAYNPAAFEAGIERELGACVAAVLASERTAELRAGTWDRYYSFLLYSRRTPTNLERLTKNLRLLHVLDLLAAKVHLPDAAALDKVLRATVLIPADLSRQGARTPAPPALPPPPREAARSAELYKGLWEDFVRTYQTAEELRAAHAPAPLLTNGDTRRHTTTEKEQGGTTLVKRDFLTGRSARRPLSARARAVLTSINIAEDAPDLSLADARVTDRLSALHEALIRTQDPELLRYMPQEAAIIPGVSSIAANLQTVALELAPFFAFGTNVRPLIKPLGVGDLKVVKQKLEKYVAGEVAHIENVLKGESKERKHRVLDRTEDTLTVSEESSEETSKDTQTTERFELKKESERTIQEQMSVQAGVTVSGSYGMVTFGAHADFAYSTSSTDSNKTASNFAREVIDKSVSKIQKRTKTERTTKTLHEVEEINTHGVTNTAGTGHITGVYRWVDKYYEAQIYNYGRRLMFEFVIPEPSTFFEFAFANKPKKNITAPIPLPAGLTHKQITEWNYQTYIRNYNVQGLTPPPPATKQISVTLDQSGIDNGRTFSKSSKELVVPEGYVSADLGFALSVIYQNNPQLKLSIGNDHGWATFTDPDAVQRWDFVVPGPGFSYDGIIPLVMEGYDVNAYSLNVTVVCNRLASKYEAWQIQAFEKIMAAYQALVAEYEQKRSAQEAQQGIVIVGQNPRINREIEKTELKKGCLKMLQDVSVYGSFDAMKAGSPPEFDNFDALMEGRLIQFFEQAFEWENLTYLFYPYFWARKSQWVHKSTAYDSDPLFTQFLQAGAARVVVPVHPAYDEAVLHYLESGQIWGGGDSPRIDDPLFISIAEELRDRTDDLGNAEKVGDPWEVVLPTTLVHLQEDGTLPTFN